MKSRRQPTELGHTLLEVMTAVALTILVTMGLAETMNITIGAQKQLDAMDRVTRAQQDALGEIRNAAFSAIRVLGDDEVGNSFLAALDTAGTPVLGDSRLPIRDPDGSLDTDEIGEPRTGNVLVVISEDRPVEQEAGGRRYRFDIVRVQAFYLSSSSESVLSDRSDRIDLVRFTSEPHVLSTSTDAIAGDANEAEMLVGLRDSGIHRVLTLDAAATDALATITDDGRIVADDAETPSIAPSLDFPTRRVLLGQRISIARNGLAQRVPQFATPDPEHPNFPCGFEVKVVGPWDASRVLVRVVLAAGSRGGHDPIMDVTKVFTIGAR